MLATSYNRAVLAGHPAIDRTYHYTKGSHHESVHRLIAGSLAKLATLARLRLRRFDVAIAAATPAGPRSRQLLRTIQARQNLAASQKGSGLHEVERIWQLGATLGLSGSPPPARIIPNPAQRHDAEARIRQALGPARIPVAVHLSSRKPSQQWPAPHFVEFLEKCARTHPSLGFALLWSPGKAGDPAHPGDDEKAAEVLRKVRHLPVVPCPTPELSQTIATLSACQLFVGSDGGAMHLAAGLALPIVCLFGASSASQWHPWMTPHRLLQSPDREVATISPDQVHDALSDLLAIDC